MPSDREKDDSYGSEVELSTDTLAIGAIGKNAPGSSNSGAVYEILIDPNAVDTSLCFITKSKINGLIVPICLE